jgi:hypothetical protein
MSRSSIVAMVILLGVPAHAFGADAPGPGGHPWTVSVAPCAGSGFSTGGVEKMMREAGYDDPEQGWWIDHSTPTPHSERVGRGAMLIVRRDFGATARLRLMLDRTNLGETHGYRHGVADSVLSGVLVFRQTVTAFSIVVDIGRRGNGGFYAGLGPSVFLVSMKNPDWDEAPSVSATKVGMTLVSGYVFTPPERERRFYLGLEAQCRVMGSVRIGPLDNPYAGHLPGAEVNFIHGVLAVELGFRL